jgi:hypothetical protein
MKHWGVVVIAVILVALAFTKSSAHMQGQTSNEQANAYDLYKTDISGLNVERALTNLAGYYHLKQTISVTKTMEIHDLAVSLRFTRFNGISRNEYAVGIAFKVNGQVHSALYTLIKVNGQTTNVEIFPIVSSHMKSPYSFTLNQNHGILHSTTSFVREMGLSKGWLGIAILFNQQQTIELTALLGAGVAIAGFVAAVAGVTVVGGLVAAAIALILALGVSYITFMDAEGNFQGINIDYSYFGWGMINAPEYNIPWGF